MQRPGANTHTDSNANSYPHGNADTDAYANSGAYPYGNADSGAYANSFTCPDADSRTVCGTQDIRLEHR